MVEALPRCGCRVPVSHSAPLPCDGAHRPDGAVVDGVGTVGTQQDFDDDGHLHAGVEALGQSGGGGHGRDHARLTETTTVPTCLGGNMSCWPWPSSTQTSTSGY